MVKFWDKIIEGLAGAWNARLLLPAAAWLIAGVLAFTLRYGLATLEKLLASLNTTSGVALAVAGLFLMAVLSWLVQQLTLPFLRLFEGYWSGIFAGLAHYLARRAGQGAADLRDWRNYLYWPYAVAAQKDATLQLEDYLSAQELADYARLDFECETYPKKYAHFLPTRLGNLLRAAEEYPWIRYGLEIQTTWPRLWLVLPETARQELSQARAALDQQAQLLLWGILLSTWVLWSWWAVVAALVVAFAACQSLVAAAGAYGELLRAAYDLHRFSLYRTLGWKPPLRAQEEPACGKSLTRYLHHGEMPGWMTFEIKEK
jgi:hypothetical protein